MSTDDREPSFVTILRARYGGIYEPGKWIACPAWPEQLPPDWNADDVTCMAFFDERGDEFGGGDTPQEAYDDLLRILAASSHGRTTSGKVIDDAFIEELADEAERGFDPSLLRDRPRGRGRPPLGDAAKTVESVRLEPELRAQAAQRAADDGVTVSEIIRRALREYLRSA